MIKGPQRKFCTFIVKGLNATEAYRAAYPNTSRKAAKDNASRLLAKPEIREEIALLREKADVAAGSFVLDLLERRSFLARVVRARINELPEDSDLWIRKKLSKAIIDLRIPDKIRAILTDHFLSGDKDKDPEPCPGCASFKQMLQRIRDNNGGYPDFRSDQPSIDVPSTEPSQNQ
jgi:hypothetical protein